MIDKALEILANEQMVKAGIFILTAIIGIIVSTEWGARQLAKIKASRFATVAKFVAEAVRMTYENFVRDCKNAAADGKLTDAERREAMRMAFVYAKDKGGAAVKKYIAEHGEEHVKTLIEQAVAYVKKKKND